MINNMININMFGLIPNDRIQADNIPIYKTYQDLYDGMKRLIGEIDNIYMDKVMSFSFPITLIKDDETRVRLFAAIPTMIEDYRIRNEFLKNADKFQIKTYLVLPNGTVNLIKNFEKIYNNLDKIEQLYIKQIQDNDRTKKETFEQFRDRMINIKNNATTVKETIIACTGLAYVYQLIDEFIETHRKDLQSNLYHSIKAIREEQEANAALTNELEMLSKQAQIVLKDDTEDEFLQCIYNGEEIDQNDMINRLTNHMLYKEDVENDNQIYIEDTLEDEYRIETKKLIITRSMGGNIKITRKW